MSHAATELVWKSSRQHGNRRLVLLALADRANDKMMCWPGVEDIAERCKLKRRGVQAILAELEAAGEIAREYRRGTGPSATTVYHLSIKPVHDDAPVHADARVHDDAQTGAPPCADGCTAVRKGVHGHAPKPSGTHKEPTRNRHNCSRAEEIYRLYPRKVARTAALKAIAKALKTADAEHLTERTKAYAAAVSRWPEDQRQYVPYPASWYNAGRYDDDPGAWEYRGKDAPRTLSPEFDKF